MSEDKTPDFTSLTSPGTDPKITSIFDFSTEALGQMKLWLEQAGINIPIGQVTGFLQFAPSVATPVAAQEQTTSTTYTDLATAGPTLTGLPDGKYLILFGATVVNAAGSGGGYVSVQGNSTAAIDADAIFHAGASISDVNWVDKTLSSGSDKNTVTMKYRWDGTNSHADFSNRRMFVIRHQ